MLNTQHPKTATALLQVYLSVKCEIFFRLPIYFEGESMYVAVLSELGQLERWKSISM